MSTNNEDDGHLPLTEPESKLLFAAGQFTVSELANLLTEYFAKFPKEAARFEEMASAEPLEAFTPVTETTPLEEYGRRIEDIQRLLTELEPYEITTRNVGLTIILCASLQNIKSIARRDPYGMFDKISRRTKQYLDFLQGRRMDGETAKQPAVSSHSGSKSSHEKASTGSTLPGTQPPPPPKQDVGDAANDLTSPRNKSEAAGRGHTNVKIQFNWLGKSSARPNDVITLEMLNDPEKKVLVDDWVSGPGDYILFHQPSAMPVLSGHTVTIRVPDDDVEAFKTAIRMQWSLAGMRIPRRDDRGGEKDSSGDEDQSEEKDASDDQYLSEQEDGLPTL
ncbi:hypothetical protein N3K66_005896 [Trichothecium roseum]|uniref:Uncharacterized protein n=1 Tax=Trichothecium roseum TaxID=47278 RepID=A0ACC0V1U8_9HYPO|nr:hypothetical protein N3K66_005896 [Trichothecium roseum]